MSTLQLYLKTARLAIPAILENLFISVVFLVDALMLSHLGTAALAAAGMASLVMWRMRGVAAFMQVGIGAYVSRRWGSGDSEAARVMFTHGAVIGFSIGACFLGLYPFIPAIFRGLHAEEAVLKEVVSYFVPILFAFPIRVASVHIAAALRASGDTRTPMFTTIAMNITHVFSNSALIFGHFGAPALGMRGAGISTALAMTMEFFMLLIVSTRGVRPKRLFKLAPIASAPAHDDEIDVVAPVYTPAAERDDVLKFTPVGFRPWLHGKTAAVMRISVPTLCEEIALSIGFLSFIAMIADLGDAQLAASTSISRIESFSFNAGFGVSIAASTLVGQALGAGSSLDARRAMSACLTLAVLLMGGAGILFAIWPHWFLHWFSAGEGSGFITIAVPLFFLTAIQQPLIGMTNVLAGSLRGAGQTKAPFIAQMVGVIGIRIGLAYYMAFVLGLGMEGLFLATILDWVVRTTILGFIIMRTRWDKVVV